LVLNYFHGTHFLCFFTQAYEALDQAPPGKTLLLDTNNRKELEKALQDN
jgi:hypothetical protein